MMSTTFIEGTLEKITEKEFDLIFANINRNVILKSFPSLYKMLAPEGILIISGILSQDVETVETGANESGFTMKNTLRRNNWLSISFVK